MSRRVCGAAVLFALLLDAVSAHADEAPRAGLELSAPEGCPAREEVMRWIEDELGGARPAPRRVEMSVTGPPFEGTLRVGDGASSRTRVLAGGSCADVTRALALVAAMALREVAPPPASLPVPPEPAPASPPKTAEAAPPRDALEVAPAESAHHARWLVGASFESGAILEDIGRPPLGASGFVELSARTGPSLRLTASLTDQFTNHEYGRLEERRYVARLEGCPTALQVGRFALRPCAGLGGGVRTLANQPRTLVSPTYWDDPFVIATAMARARFRVMGDVFVDGGLGFGIPLLPDRVHVSEGSEAHVTEPVLALASLGLGLGFR